MRGSSVHFKRISSALHAVSHASREIPPEYLLPDGMSMGTHVVIDDHGQVQKMLDHKMHLASRQAKATKDYSPLWEGVINLPSPSPDVTPEHQVEIVRRWCNEYEAMTGHKVLRADVHLDEGYIDATGHAQYNAHAHVMCDRTDDKGKVKKLTSTVLREVQNMTAEVTTLQRGLPAKQTQRRHVGHQHFRFDAEKNRLDLEKPKADLARLQKRSKEWSDADLAKVNKLQSKVDGEPARQAAALAAQKTQLDEQYRQDRDALKATGEATQRDYQQLKKAHEAALADLAKAQAQAAKVPDLVEQLKVQSTINGNLLLNEAESHKRHMAEIAQLKAEYAAERAALKASGEAKQADYQALKLAHETALAALSKLTEKVETMTAENQALTEANAKLEADKARFAAMAQAYQAAKTAGVPAHLIEPSSAPSKNPREAVAPAPQAPVKASKQAVEAPKQPKAPTPLPTSEKSLLERLEASYRVFLDWIKAKGGVLVDLDTQQSDHYGPVVQLDDLHAVQSTGKGKHVVHELARLDRVPVLDDSKTEISYRAGVGQVKGRGVGKGGLGD